MGSVLIELCVSRLVGCRRLGMRSLAHHSTPVCQNIFVPSLLSCVLGRLAFRFTGLQHHSKFQVQLYELGPDCG